MAKLNIGDKIPHFELTTQDGEPFTDKMISSGKGESTILYFYPKDNTSGCTLQAKNLRDGMEELSKAGFRVIGVSPDSERSHCNFIAKHELNFTLLADVERTMCEAFGVWVEKSMYGRKYMGVARTTFIIDNSGVVTDIFEKVETKRHTEQILERLNK
ncbi:MAG: thioredoxin-dependent thiol peroxidase [Rikenellaceae bacterium]